MKNPICKIKGHRWRSGFCSRCGIEHTPHEWAPQPGACIEKCVRCEKVRAVPHTYTQRSGCEMMCVNCGHTITKHHFAPAVGCRAICTVCGTETVIHHWNPVQKLSPDYKAAVTAEGCKCTVCGALNPRGEHTFVRRRNGNEIITVCAVCGIVADRVPAPPIPTPPATGNN